MSIKPFEIFAASHFRGFGIHDRMSAAKQANSILNDAAMVGYTDHDKEQAQFVVSDDREVCDDKECLYLLRDITEEVEECACIAQMEKLQSLIENVPGMKARLKNYCEDCGRSLK